MSSSAPELVELSEQEEALHVASFAPLSRKQFKRLLDAGECVAVVAAAGAATALTTLARGAQCAPAAHSPDLGHGLARHPGQLCVPVGSSA